MTVRSMSLFTALFVAACAGESPIDDDPRDAPTTTPDEVVDFAAHGAAPVGFAVLTDSDLTVKAWYPSTTTAPEDIEYLAQVRLFGPDSDPMPFYGAAVANAAPDAAQGPYPLVVLSHGFGMNPEWYHPLAEHLASRGYVVLAPEHIEYDWFTDVVSSTVSRPLQVSQTIDFAASGILSGAIDTEHIAVVGHSYGGTTALMAGGAQFQTDWLEESCAIEEDPFLQSFFCEVLLGGTEQLAGDMGLDAVPTGLWPSLADERVDAIVAMAPDGGLFGDVGLAQLDVPAMFIGGTGDTAAPWSWGGELAWDHVSSPTRAMVAFEGSDHFIVTTTCDHMPWTAGLPEEYAGMFCDDPAWDKADALALTNETVAAFLAHTLRQDGAGRMALEPERFAEVEGLEVRFEETSPGLR